MRNDDSVTVASAVTGNGKRASGWVLGGLGVLVFSFTLPANAWAVQGLDPVAVTALRVLLPGLVAIALLRVMKAPVPEARSWAALIAAGLCTAVGFPLLSSIALTSIAPDRAALIMSLLPALTAVFARALGKERPPVLFWMATATGTAVLGVYLALRGGAGARLGDGDAAMFGATCCSALGYVFGADRAKVLGGPQSMCWALVALLPVSIPASVIALARHTPSWTPESAAGLLYLALISTLLGYFAWYTGLARGGIARVGQVQQIQPILTICWSALFFGEPLDVRTFIAGAVIAGLIGLAQRARTTTGQDTTALVPASSMSSSDRVQTHHYTPPVR